MRTKQNPILVVGSHRSGTTFLGKMLSIPHSLGLIYEPFHPHHGMEGIDQFFVYIREGMKDEAKYRDLTTQLLEGCVRFKRELKNDKYYKDLLRYVLRGKSHIAYRATTLNPLVKRLVLKDPHTCFSAEYLHRNFDMKTVVVIRHPASFIASIKRLNWGFYFQWFYTQEELMNDHLKSILTHYDINALTKIEKNALVWKCMYTVLHKYLNNNRAMIGVRLEDLSLRPVEELQNLYNLLGIDFTPRVRKTIQAYTQNRGNNTLSYQTTNGDPVFNYKTVHVLKRDSASYVKMWNKYLTEEECRQVRDITEDIAGHYYTDDDW